MMIPYLLAITAAYLVGSIPFGYLAGLSRGVDIRTVGSGNIGATNVFRTFGKKLGVATFVLDVFKGIAATCVIPQGVWLLMGLEGSAPLAAEMACAVFVLVGHSFPVFLNFKGGKGVATGLGIAIGVAPHSALLGFGVWLVSFVPTRYVSVASIAAAFSVGVGVWFFDNSREPRYLVPAVASILAALIVYKHKANMVRLLHGNENRFSFKRKKQ